MKLQKIIEINPILPFTEFDLMQKYRKGFESSELGRLHAMLPLKEMAEQLASAFPKKHPQGNTPMFPPEGEIALMFLKSIILPQNRTGSARKINPIKTLSEHGQQLKKKVFSGFQGQSSLGSAKRTDDAAGA